MKPYYCRLVAACKGTNRGVGCGAVIVFRLISLGPHDSLWVPTLIIQDMHYRAKTSLIAKRFSSDFSEITLTQLGSPDPLVISGVGIVAQDEFGSLRLKVFQQIPLETEKTFQYCEEKSRGKFSAAGSCSLRAVQYDGSTWTCSYLKTQEALVVGKKGCTGVFSADVGRLENTYGIPIGIQKSSFEGIVPFELDLPFNLGADGKRRSYPERMLKFTFNKVTKIEILRCDGYTTIRISNKFELISERFIEVLTQALSVATGRTVKFIWRLTSGDYFHHKVISEFDFELSRGALPALLDLRYGDHFLHFLESYIKFGLRWRHNYFGYWEKLHASWASGLVVAALPLAVYIEGVMKEFYPELMTVDAKLEEDIRLTVSGIERLEGIDPHVKERMRNRIRGAAASTVTNGLRSLAEQGHIDGSLVANWKTVRHRSAHGDDFTREQVAKIQKIVTGIYSCLHLFYKLLYLKLDFSGYIIDYSKIGFPTEFRFAEKVKVKKK